VRTGLEDIFLMDATIRGFDRFRKATGSVLISRFISLKRPI
jgi:hypothetical protein